MPTQKSKSWIGATLILLGVILLCVAVGVQKRASNAGFGTTLALAGAALAAGVSVLIWLPVTAAVPQPPPVPLPPRSILKPTSHSRGGGVGMALPTEGNRQQRAGAGTPPLPVRSPRPASSVSWSDGDSRSPLERVVEFEKEEPPAIVAAAESRPMPAHAPKAVPAIPNRLRMPVADAVGVASAGDGRPYEPATPPVVDVPKLRMGYQSGLTAGQPCALAAEFQPPIPPTAGPLYYAPTFKGPTVNELIEERRRFQERPDTPELQRHRRMGAMWEAAMSIPVHLQRSGLILPVSGPALPLPSEVQVQEAVADAINEPPL